MRESAGNNSSLDQVDYICIAAELLQRMMSELDLLTLDNQRLALAMATAGHDLRHHLHALLGTIELLTRGCTSERSAELSCRAKSLIFRLTKELEKLARQAECGSTADWANHRFSISTVLEQVKADWGQDAEAKQLHFTIAWTDCLVESDPDLLTSILNNIVGNAVSHTRHGRVTVESRVEGRFLVLSVIDTGPGISEEDLLRSSHFSRRARGKGENPKSLGTDRRATGGMGFGLGIARESADMLGHAFEVATSQNRGTCVRLHIPLADSESIG
jgi:signal transduction histidine kinase